MKASLITAILVLSIVGSSFGDDLQLRIRFLDEPAYGHCWLPWVDDEFRVEMVIENRSNTTLAVEKSTACNDCNPTFHVESVESGTEPERLMERDVLYILSDRLFVDLEPGEVLADTIDIASYIEYDLEGGAKYRLWFEYRAWPGYQLKDTTRTAPIWTGNLISDTLEFTY